jgi:leader peptidase (prepilin peptidase)/N-methyltransferase
MFQMFNELLDNLHQINEVYPFVIYISVLLFGAAVGSFLNVVIYRTPIMLDFEYAEIIKANADNVHPGVEESYNKGNGMSLSLPRSRCSCCGKMIPWYHNIPVLSYFILRGKCFNCKEGYSARYVIVEIFNAVAWVALFHFFGLTITFAALAVLTSLLIALSMIDFDHKILPDNLVFLTGVLGLLFSTTSSSLLSPTEAIYQSLIAFFGANIFIGAYSKLRGMTMMGFGDIKLIGVLTLFIGLPLTLNALMIACISGIVYYVLLKFSKTLDADKTFAFGPFLCLGYFVMLVHQLMIVSAAT